MKNKICCICNNKINGYGNNPAGAMWLNEFHELEEFEPKADDRCCDDCNMKYVVPGRLYKLNHRGEK